MEFRKITSAQQVADYLSGTIRLQLDSGKSVFWLVSGGSAIDVAVKTAQKLQGTRKDKLTVSLVDERWGPIGHPDSNWHQLAEAGFSLKGANLLPVLTGKDRENTANDFANLLLKHFSDDFVIGLLGIGPDGHTSGILPHSSAVHATGLTHDYKGGGYERITTTAHALAKLDEAVVYAIGEVKWPVLDSLETDIDPDEQPAQFLKQVPKVIIFNNRKGEPA